MESDTRILASSLFHESVFPLAPDYHIQEILNYYEISPATSAIKDKKYMEI
jgi:hypothetical protein